MNWEPVNLANLEERPPIRPTLGGVGLAYPGKRHVFSGPPESAKTIAAYAVGLEEIRTGGTVLLIDFEMGPWEARDRLREMGASDTELERLIYVEPETPATEELIRKLIDEWTPTLAIIDAAAGAYGLQGLDDRNRTDVEMFARAFVRSFWLREIATIVLDHVVKNADNRGRFAIGSERKIGGADVHLGFEIVVPVHRGGRGVYRVITHKDRLGYLPRPKAAELELRSDPETHAITWKFKTPEPSEDAPWRPTIYMERVSRWLEIQADAVSRNEVEKNVRGTGDYVRQALDALIVDGYVSETAGIRGSRPVRSLRPYRQDDLVGTSSALRRDEDTTPSATASAASPPLRGDADAVDDEDEVERILEKHADLVHRGRQ